jgi:hypothetical protein
MGTPQEIVREFVISRLSKPRYIDPFRIRTAKNMAYGTAFACRVEALQDDG